MEEGEAISYDAQGRPRWGRRAAGLLIERSDTKEVMLTLRSELVMDPGVWGIPGGRVEPGESDLEAAGAEAEEELGSLPVMQIVGESSMTSGEFTYTTFRTVVSGAIADAWEPILNWESDDWGWFSVKKLPKNMHLGVKAILGGKKIRTI